MKKLIWARGRFVGRTARHHLKKASNLTGDVALLAGIRALIIRTMFMARVRGALVTKDSTLAAPDHALEEVRAFLTAKPDLLGIVGRAIRKSFDEVIDGARTGRYSIDQLEKTEKTYIGTKVEIVLRAELSLARGTILDYLIEGHEVDSKFTVGSNWMIPREARNQLCLLSAGDDKHGQCRIGLIRAVPGYLTSGLNQDKKNSVSAQGKQHIVWLAQGAMPRNFMLDLPDAARHSIIAAVSGKQAIRELFRNATGRLIPRSVIEQVAQQKDAAKRAREAKADLAAEGIQVLCATYMQDRAEFVRHGFTSFNEDDWLSIRASEYGVASHSST